MFDDKFDDSGSLRSSGDAENCIAEFLQASGKFSEAFYIFICLVMKTTKRISTYCDSETKTLKEVVLGYPDNFHRDPSIVEIVNVTQEAFYNSPNKPTAEKAKPEFNIFQKTMENNGIRVHRPQPCRVADQFTPRDIGFVIGNKFFRSSMAKESRKNEWHGIGELIKNFNRVIHVPDSIVIEGGDIIVDKGYVFVGISQRTTMLGFEWLKSQLQGSDFQTIPVPLKSLSDGEDCLHLDCAFVPVGRRHALIYPDGFQTIRREIIENYHWIEVTKKEQMELGTNVLSLSPVCVITRDIAKRINRILNDLGLEVIPLEFDEAPKTGGSFRCCTLPLIRKRS
ncbi:hypothetical protein HZA38_03240 [Candidatus Peregrinibacteria bacterium]|nr:hypothetical protein [Candidatus Peregrinibacteria bacterium]